MAAKRRRNDEDDLDDEDLDCESDDEAALALDDEDDDGPEPDWRHYFAALKSPGGLGSTVLWVGLWVLLGMNPWVGLGLSFALLGSLRWHAQQAMKRETDAAAAALPASVAAPPPGESPPPPLPLHLKVIADAAEPRERLRTAASLAIGETGRRLRAMNAHVDAAAKALDADPSRLSEVQRLFTYYLPATADLLARLTSVGADEARAVEIHAMLAKLEPAFADFAERARGEDAKALEIDLKLLERTLADDFAGKTKT